MVSDCIEFLELIIESLLSRILLNQGKEKTNKLAKLPIYAKLIAGNFAEGLTYQKSLLDMWLEEEGMRCTRALSMGSIKQQLATVLLTIITAT